MRLSGARPSGMVAHGKHLIQGARANRRTRRPAFCLFVPSAFHVYRKMTAGIGTNAFFIAFAIRGHG